jgi:hypothetical protein
MNDFNYNAARIRDSRHYVLLQDIAAAIASLQREFDKTMADVGDAETAFEETLRVTEKATTLAFKAIALLDERRRHIGSFRSKIPQFLKRAAKLKRLLEEQTRRYGASN